MKKRLKLWINICLFEAGRFKAYPLEIFAGIFSRVAEVAILSSFWLIVSQAAGANINLSETVGYFLIIGGISPFFYTGFGIAGLTVDMIKNGELNQTLIRPINPIIYPWALRTGRNAINLAFGVLQIAAGMIVSGGIDAHAAPFLIPVLLNAAALNASFNIFIGAMGFYLTDARHFKNAFYHVASFLRGERMPLYLMEPGFAQLLMFTPFPASIYHLTTVLHGHHLPTWPDILIGSVWAVALLVLSVKIWKLGLRRYEAVGI